MNKTNSISSEISYVSSQMNQTNSISSEISYLVSQMNKTNSISSEISYLGSQINQTNSISSEISYLGSQMNQTNSISSEIQARIPSGNRCYYAYGKLMKSRALNRSSKLKIYKILVRPTVTYGCEAWTLADRDEQHLRIFERRILR